MGGVSTKKARAEGVTGGEEKVESGWMRKTVKRESEEDTSLPPRGDQ